MARTPSIVTAEPWRSFVSLLLIILLIGFSVPPSVMAAPPASAHAVAPSVSPAAPGGLLASARMSLAALQTRVSLATKAIISELNPPSEFARIKSQFEEPLIVTGPTSAKEDAGLLKALKLYRDRAVEDDFSALVRFLKDHLHSPWRVALLTNLGLLNYHYGYFSRAISDWERAWQQGRNVTDIHARAVVDRAVGELARMHARLGHADELEALFKDLGGRPVTGPATEAIAGAHQGLWMMRHQPGVAYLCGPMALRSEERRVG